MQEFKAALFLTIIVCVPAAIPGMLALLVTHNGLVATDTFMGATVMDVVAAWWILRRFLPPEEEA